MNDQNYVMDPSLAPQAPQAPQGEQFDISKLPPNVLAQLLGLDQNQGEIDQTQAAIARSQALQQAASGGGYKPTEGIGAALGGIGDIMNAYRGHKEAKAGQAREADLQNQRRAELAQYAGMMHPQTAQQVPDMIRAPQYERDPNAGPFGF